MHSNIILPGLEEAIIINAEVRKEQYIIHFEMPVVKQICPSCQAETTRIHDYRMTKIKHLKFGERMTTLFYRKRRYVCACKKRFAEKNSIVDRYQRYSKEWNQMAQAGATRRLKPCPRNASIWNGKQRGIWKPHTLATIMTKH